jgi:predicted nucleic acid-binding protein
MGWLLDTNVWITVLKQRETPLLARLAAAPPAELFVCAINWTVPV